MTRREQAESDGEGHWSRRTMRRHFNTPYPVYDSTNPQWQKSPICAWMDDTSNRTSNYKCWIQQCNCINKAQIQSWACDKTKQRTQNEWMRCRLGKCILYSSTKRKKYISNEKERKMKQESRQMMANICVKRDLKLRIHYFLVTALPLAWCWNLVQAFFFCWISSEHQHIIQGPAILLFLWEFILLLFDVSPAANGCSRNIAAILKR